MLVLSILIMLALGAAVVSFFIAGAQWLLLVSAALVLFAFYLSRRAPSLATSNDSIPESAEPWTAGFPAAAIDEQTPQLGRAHDSGPASDRDNDRDNDDQPAPDRAGNNRPQVHPENGHAIAS